ncbi:hypothetical protein [Herbidospora sp. NBRC 101105]|uniref:hypothetical protein n=1 Tax=Herbidospora sp. NBRC 101105 TaxID=3032195 RepID=UPI0024A19A52|nr:hypothetical protein [Herbidospora sp. NBRC 101105]GLX93254.1 hypothetical protein Hesp01_12040 [Herbidospora sp. NBRC 101105]
MTAFSGLPAREGPLTMGQANMVRCVRTDPPEHMNYRVVRGLPAGASVEDAVRTLVARHESLRTTFHGDVQRVHGSGVIAFGAEADHTARFDVENELPLRVGVSGDQVTLVTTHSAADAAGLAVLLADWDDIVVGKPLDPVTAPQPVDVALAETSPAGRKRAEAALRYWDGALSRVPRSTLTASVDDTGHEWRLPRLRIRSAGAARALARISARTGVSGSAAVLAAYAALSGLRGGLPLTGVLSISANRFRPDLRSYVGPLAQDALVPVPVSASFEEVLAGVRGAALGAYQNSRFDADALISIMERVQRERGVFFARDLVFNDMSGTGRNGRPATSGDEVRATWLPEATLPCRTALWVHRLHGELDLTLWADPRVLPREDALLLGEGIAKTLIAAGHGNVSDISEISGIAPIERDDSWVFTDGQWVSLPEVTKLVTDACGIPASVGADLVCQVETPMTPAQLHTECLRLLPGRMAAITPRHYVVAGTEGSGR